MIDGAAPASPQVPAPRALSPKGSRGRHLQVGRVMARCTVEVAISASPNMYRSRESTPPHALGFPPRARARVAPPGRFSSCPLPWCVAETSDLTQHVSATRTLSGAGCPMGARVAPLVRPCYGLFRGPQLRFPPHPTRIGHESAIGSRGGPCMLGCRTPQLYLEPGFARKQGKP